MKIFLAIILFFSFLDSNAQVPAESLKVLQKLEDSLKTPGRAVVMATRLEDRFAADSIFTKIFVRALKVPYSFSFPFDSLQSISRLYPEDSSFRIFTWQLVVNENLVRQHGAIQVHTADGSLKLFPLIDKSDVTTNSSDTVASNLGWMGAVYYKIIQTRKDNKAFYTLLGFDENNIRTDKRVIEILHFEEDKPIFGAPLFVFEKKNEYNKKMARFVMEFKKDASPRLTFDKDLDMIVMEHLVSESGEAKKKWTLVPDGDYEGFQWKNGYWAYISKIFNQVTPLGQAPVPEPLNEEKTNVKNNQVEQ